MRIAVVGSGGREHALLATLAQSPDVDRLFAVPGNAGTAEVAENVPGWERPTRPGWPASPRPTGST